MSTIPEEFREDVECLADWFAIHSGPKRIVDRLVACLPEPEPTFTDAEALAFAQAVWADEYTARAIRSGRLALDALAKAGWTAPKALCPPPSPALVELVEAARGMGRWGSQRLEAAVAAYDEQEGTP